ncbi:MAG: type 4a pilus biogenesis protein PilO, partial [Actinomycetota bacterium]
MSGRRTPIIAGVAVALIAVLAFMFLVRPKMSQVSEAQVELEAAQDDEIVLEAQLRTLQDAQAAAPETERQISLIEDQVPPTADLPALIRLLQSAADRAAVDFFSFTPATPVADATGQFSTISSSITVTGGYFSIDEFLFLIETLPRAAKGVSISVAPGGGDAAVGTSQT